MTAPAPGREELLAQNRKDAREFCVAAFGPFVLDVSQYVEIITKVMEHATDRALAANPSPAPDAMNEQRAEEDARLVANVREATIEECALVAAKWASRIGCHASEIATAIRALSTTGEPKR